MEDDQCRTVFYIAGGLDLLICPPPGILDAYRRTNASAAVATRRDAEHIHLPQDATGYLTAWLRYRLTGDHVAASAFTGPAPELNRNPEWTDQTEQDLQQPGARVPPTGGASIQQPITHQRSRSRRGRW
jgi:hypothetical protein